MQTEDEGEVMSEDQATGTTNPTTDTAEAVLESKHLGTNSPEQESKNLGTNSPELESKTAETAREEGEENETMKETDRGEEEETERGDEEENTTDWKHDSKETDNGLTSEVEQPRVQAAVPEWVKEIGPGDLVILSRNWKEVKDVHSVMIGRVKAINQDQALIEVLRVKESKGPLRFEFEWTDTKNNGSKWRAFDYVPKSKTASIKTATVENFLEHFKDKWAAWCHIKKAQGVKRLRKAYRV
jgi:exosome complex RNA-binding protein Csl4